MANEQISLNEFVAQLHNKGLSVADGIRKSHAALNLGHTATVRGEHGETSIKLVNGNVVVNCKTTSFWEKLMRTHRKTNLSQRADPARITWPTPRKSKKPR